MQAEQKGRGRRGVLRTIGAVDVDAIIVGAGVVGLACAQRLASTGRSVVVVERHGSFGQETSSRNSEVIHAGIYYPTGSLKARLCVEGNRLLYDWCRRRGVAHAQLGKYIIATEPNEEPALDSIQKQARENGARELTRVTAADVRAAEPNVRVAAALWSPTTGIVDSHDFMRSLAAVATDAGCTFAWKHRLVRVEQHGRGYSVTLAGLAAEEQSLTARVLINAAGLASDDVAQLGGVDIAGAGYRQTYVKGHYFRIAGRVPVKHLIYPVPPVGLTGLGVHVTLDMHGVARLGPDVEVLVDRAQRYDVPEALAPKFLASASRYLVGLRREDLAPDYAGIRPKLGIPGGPVRDFVVAEESHRGLPGWVNLVGIESPGLTASLAIAEHVASLLGEGSRTP
jgi:L-2-hydroxyglutarate oxidase LhgO